MPTELVHQQVDAVSGVAVVEAAEEVVVVEMMVEDRHEVHVGQWDELCICQTSQFQADAQVAAVGAKNIPHSVNI